MAKRRKNKPGPKQNGFVYLLSLVINNTVYYKIGTTNRTVRHRLLEVAGELHDNLGYIPVMAIVTEKQVLNNYQVETELLRLTAEHKPKPGKELNDTFSGYSEIRCMDLGKLKTLLAECVAKDYPTVQPTLIEM